MSKFVQPVVVVSKCLGFDSCRWNGVTVSNEFVDSLKPFVHFITVCPEVEIGLGVPRKPVRIVKGNEKNRLYQPDTGRDITDEMESFVNSFLDSLDEVDGFILKYKSPSCGMYGVKLYSENGNSPAGKTRGFFGREIIERFSNYPIEDEGRLRNFTIREHFLTTLFNRASFREVKKSGKMKELVRFHADSKLLFMAYNQKRLKTLGRICANPDKKPFPEVIKEYEENLTEVFQRAPRYTSNINVLMHALGYFSKNLNPEERAFFLEALDNYRDNRVPLSVPSGVIRSWIVRFKEDYLADQTFFEPYPLELVEITDSGKGRKLK